MFLLLVLFSFLGLSLPQPALAGNVDPSDPVEFSFSHRDQQLHMAVAYGLSFTLTQMLEAQKLSRAKSVLFASLITMTFATFKEWQLDARYSRGDQYANLIGVGANALVVFTFGL